MNIAPQEPAHTAPVFQPCTLVASGSHSWWLPHVESKDDRKCVQRGFSPDFTDILGHVFAFLALNRIAHLLLHILTPDKSYDPPLFQIVVLYSLWHLLVHNGGLVFCLALFLNNRITSSRSSIGTLLHFHVAANLQNRFGSFIKKKSLSSFF